MEKSVRQQMIELLSTVEEGIRYIQVSGQITMFEECIEALTSIAEACQQGLSVKRYRDYAKIFDTLIATMRQSSTELLVPAVIDETCDLCCQLLQMLMEELQDEKEVKKEILFLPYKASMWDSMESIWMAARDDQEHCNVYVMPIPYCDRNLDGSPAKWYCESGLFPDYVSLVDYRQYDIAERRPDVIYIHNPYDDCNRVTSVDSRYYSRELKKYTNMLVYVPYFIMGREWPKSQVQLPCYQYIDKMIVPHENMRILSEQGDQPDSCFSDYIPIKKLVPLGSPKADKVFFCEKNKIIPSSWREIIKEKKVILYNVSLSSILQFGEQALQKMKFIFNCFINRSDIVLLWRPHPLMNATLKSMRMDLYDKYKSLENEFIAKQVGIFDETPDINMAVAIADAYLGENSSSVVHLFGVAGKPIFFTSEMMLWKNPSLDELASVRFGHMVLENEEAWFIAEGYNAFCRMNLISGEITPLIKFEDFPIKSGLYSSFLKIDNTILFSPGTAKEICEYNIETQECKKTPFKNPTEYANFGHIAQYKNYAYLLPWNYSAILRYDLETGACKYYTDCLKELLECKTPGHDGLLGDYCVRGQKLLLPSIQTNKILEFDMETEAYQYYTAGKESEGSAFIIENGDDYWLIPWKTRTIVKWNYQTGEWKSYAEYPETFSCAGDWHSGDTKMFSGAVQVNKNIWLFPYYTNMVLRLDLSTEKIVKADLELPYGIYDRKSNFYMQQPNFSNAFASENNTIVALSAYDRSLVIVDTASGEHRLQPCRLSNSDVEALSTPLEHSFGKVGQGAPYASNENGLWRNVENFIEYVISESHDKDSQQKAYVQFIKNTDGSCGEKVHRYIMELDKDEGN